MFPKFNFADSPNWNTVIKRASDGAADALSALGYQGDADKYPTCQEIRAFVGGAGKKGSEIRKYFMGEGYGWPQDAVDGSLLALVAAGLVRASKNGQPVPLKQITQGQIGVIDFVSEGLTVSVTHRMGVRKILTELGLQFNPGEESDVLPVALDRLIEFADGAGGEPPLPQRPSTTTVVQLRALSGNEQLLAVYDRRDELSQNLNAFNRATEQIAQRKPAWDTLTRLLAHADTQSVLIAAKIKPQVDAIRIGRTLLTEPDPVPPLANALTNALRPALQSARQRLLDTRQREVGALEATAEWQKIAEQERRQILAVNSLDAVAEIVVSTDDALLRTLDEYPLAKWEDLIAALPARVARAREQAAKLLEPQAVRIKPPSATLRTDGDVEKYLERLREEIMKEIDAGKTVIV